MWLYLRKSETNVEAIPINPCRGNRRIALWNSNQGTRLTTSSSAEFSSSICVRGEKGSVLRMQRRRSLDRCDMLFANCYIDRNGNWWNTDASITQNSTMGTGNFLIPARKSMYWCPKSKLILNYGDFGIQFYFRVTSLASSCIAYTDNFEWDIEKDGNNYYLTVNDFVSGTLKRVRTLAVNTNYLVRLTYSKGVFTCTCGSSVSWNAASKQYFLTCFYLSPDIDMMYKIIDLSIGSTEFQPSTPARYSVVTCLCNQQWMPAKGTLFSSRGSIHRSNNGFFGDDYPLHIKTAGTGLISTINRGINLNSDSSEKLTIECWVNFGNLDSTSGGDIIPLVTFAESESSGCAAFSLGIRKNRALYATFNQRESGIATNNAQIQTKLTNNGWHHVGFRINGMQFRMWCDGVEGSNNTLGGNFTATRLCIGFNPSRPTQNCMTSDGIKISNVRIRFGAIYSDDAPQIPSAPFDYDANDFLLLSC